MVKIEPTEWDEALQVTLGLGVAFATIAACVFIYDLFMYAARNPDSMSVGLGLGFLDSVFVVLGAAVVGAWAYSKRKGEA